MELEDIDERLLWMLRRCGDEWGPMGVAQAAASLVGPVWQERHGMPTAANLGLATTGELIDEIRARIEVHGPGLDYRPAEESLITVSPEPSPPVNQFWDAENVESLLAQMVGAGSVCWENMKGTGTFNDHFARKIVDDGLSRLHELLHGDVEEGHS